MPEDAHRQIGPIAGISLISATVVLPVFLTGALGFAIRPDLSMSVAGIGAALSLFFGITSVGAPVMGRIVQRRGAAWGLTTAGVIASLALIWLALAGSPWMLFGALAVGGVANAVLHPAAALALSVAVVPHRRALAFGIKQSSVPFATLLAGLAVPAVAIVLGWRWMIAAAALVALVAGLALPPRRALRGGAQGAGREAAATTRVPLLRLVLLAVGGSLGMVANVGAGTFYVDGAIDAGLTEELSGLAFSAGSAVAIAARVVIGWWADASTTVRRFDTPVVLLVVAAGGFACLVAGGRAGYLAAAVLAIGIGWGWTGLFNYLCVAGNPQRTAVAMGVVTSGLAFGAAVGPVLLGVIAEEASFRAAWATMGSFAVLAAAAISVAARMK